MPRAPKISREKLLAVAAEVLMRHGVRKTTLRDVATAAHVSHASVLYQFESKDALFAAVMDVEWRRLFDLVRQRIERARTAEDKLRAFFLTRFRYIGRRRKEFGLFDDSELEYVAVLMPLVHRTMERHRAEEFRVLREIIDEGRRRGEFSVTEPDVVARTMIAGLSGVQIAMVMYGPSWLPARGLEELFRLLMDGVRRRGSEGKR